MTVKPVLRPPFTEVNVVSFWPIVCSPWEKFALHWESMESELALEWTDYNFTCQLYSMLWNSHWSVAMLTNSRCILRWIFQEPSMMKTCFNFSNTLPLNNESLCSIRIRLDTENTYFISFVDYRIHSNSSALSVNKTWSWCIIMGSKSDLKSMHFWFKNHRFYLILCSTSFMMKGGGSERLLGHERLFEWIRYK